MVKERFMILVLGVTSNCIFLLLINHEWLFPAPTSNALMDIFREIPLEIQPSYDFDDELVWTLEDDGSFTLKSAYRILTFSKDQNLRWPPLIWFPGCIKKHPIRA